MNPKAKRVMRSVKYFFIFVILVAIFVGIIVLYSLISTAEAIFSPHHRKTETPSSTTAHGGRC